MKFVLLVILKVHSQQASLGPVMYASSEKLEFDTKDQAEEMALQLTTRTKIDYCSISVVKLYPRNSGA